MICVHFKPQNPAIRAFRKDQLNSFVYNEDSLCSFITYLREASYYTPITLAPESLQALNRFERAHAH